MHAAWGKTILIATSRRHAACGTIFFRRIVRIWRSAVRRSLVSPTHRNYADKGTSKDLANKGGGLPLETIN